GRGRACQLVARVMITHFGARTIHDFARKSSARLGPSERYGSHDHQRTGGIDGWVSMVHDTAHTVTGAKELYNRGDRANLFIKIPGTKEGIPAIEQAIFDGVPINVTLLFSAEQYVAAAQAYMRGLERRIESGLRPMVWSVASVFISRWDKAVLNRVSGELRDQL